MLYNLFICMPLSFNKIPFCVSIWSYFFMNLGLFEHFVKLIVKYYKLRASDFHYG